MYEYDIYLVQGGSHTTLSFLNAELYIKSYVNYEKDDEIYYIETINDTLWTVYCNNIKVGIIHKHKEVTINSLSYLFGINLDNWINNNMCDKAHQLTDKFINSFNVPLDFYDIIYEYMKQIKNEH